MWFAEYEPIQRGVIRICVTVLAPPQGSGTAWLPLALVRPPPALDANHGTSEGYPVHDGLCVDILIPSPVVVEATYLGTRCLEDFLTPNAGRSCCSERLGIAACHLLELLLLSRSIIVCQSTVAASGTRFFQASSPTLKPF